MQLTKFKRFESLTIANVPATARLVVVTGRNGSGKSGILEAINLYRRQQRFGTGQGEYFFKKSGEEILVPPMYNQVIVDFHEGPQNTQQLISGIWVRPAFRHQGEFSVQAITKQPPANEDPGVDRLITADSLVAGNYGRLMMASIEKLYDASNRQRTADQIVSELIGQLQEALTFVFDDLQLDSLSDPLGEGTFFFTKGTSKHFSFMNLSAGERAAFDILLDVIIRTHLSQSLLYVIDEPELHLGSRVQANLIEMLLKLLPGDASQLWVATHSVGMMKRAMKFYRDDSSQVAFIDTHGSDFDTTTVLEPVVPTRSFWKRALEVALDDFADLVAPDHIVLCEGSELEDGFDASSYRIIFSQTYPSVEFLSTGNSYEVKNDKQGIASAIQIIAPGTTITKLIDRDEMSDAEVDQLGTGTKVLSLRNIESYLLADEIIEQLYCTHGKTAEDAQAALKYKTEQLRDAVQRGRPKDDLKSVAKNMRAFLVRDLQLVGAGSKFAEFARLKLAPLIAPGTKTYELLEHDIFDVT